MLGRLEDWRELDEEGALVWALQSVGLMPEREGRHRSPGIPDHRWAAVRHPLSMVAVKAEIGIGSEATKDAPPRTVEMGNPACPIRTFRRPPDGGMRACAAAASHGGAEIRGELHDDNSR
ncbi:MAG: hypothetical protein ACLQME_16310 [Alphaproteobacteria bacterium]